MRELILNFHGLGEPHPRVDDEEKLCWWSVSSFVRLLDLISERPIGESPDILLTFDDGNESDAVFALPALVKRGLKATFFICAGRVGTAHYLDKSMIEELLSCSMGIGSHGMYHRDWCALDPKELDEEVVDARRRIEDVTGRAVTKVAIPFGSYNRHVLSRLKREDWDCIYTSDRGTARRNDKIKPRETLYADMQAGLRLSELTREPRLDIRIRRQLARFYKRHAKGFAQFDRKTTS